MSDIRACTCLCGLLEWQSVGKLKRNQEVEYFGGRHVGGQVEELREDCVRASAISQQKHQWEKR